MSAIFNQVKIAKDKLAASEGAYVPALINFCVKLANLRVKAKRDWETCLDKLRMCPRAARYVKVGKSWWNDGTLGSDLMTKLPADVQKLEWLCRLDNERLEQFLGERDFRFREREDVISAVKEALGLPISSNTNRRKSPAQIDAMCTKLEEIAKEICSEIDDPDSKSRIERFETESFGFRKFLTAWILSPNRSHRGRSNFCRP